MTAPSRANDPKGTDAHAKRLLDFRSCQRCRSSWQGLPPESALDDMGHLAPQQRSTALRRRRWPLRAGKPFVTQADLAEFHKFLNIALDH